MQPTEVVDSLDLITFEQVPQTEVCLTALSQASRILPKAIFNHSVRTYLLAKWLADKEGSEWADADHAPLLFVACICHDFGASDEYNGKQRFEVEGADAAVTHLRRHNCDADEAHKVWVAIAIHTSPGIAERIDPLARLVRLGVKMDFSQAVRDTLQAQKYVDEIQQRLPRLEIEKVLASAVVNQAEKIPQSIDRSTWPDTEKHPKASWPGILLHAHLLHPDHDGVNLAF